MKSIGIIPLRKGSKGIPGKNKKKILGRPLYQWVLTEAIFSELDEIYIFTDDLEIIEQVQKEYTWTSKVKTMQRSEASSTDTASTEFAMEEFSKKINYEYDVICLLQATSPLTTRDDINNVLKLIFSEKYDSSLTVVESKRFIWSKEGKSINYNYSNRPRRQEFEGLLVENGAIYASTKEQFSKSSIRIGGNIGITKMEEDSLYEIDEMNDWLIVENLLLNRLKQLKKPLSKIKAVIIDVDGVFTDGSVAVSKEGELFKVFSMRDGMGLELLRESQITTVILTSEDSEIVRKRMKKLQLTNVFCGVKDKYSRLDLILESLNLKRNEVSYIGDDINDLANLVSCGLTFSPFDCTSEIRNQCDWLLNNKGGKLAIREMIENIIKYNNKF